MVYLYNTAKQYHVIPDKVVFGQPLKKGTYQELPLTFTFSGQVDLVLSIIKHLQYAGTPRFAIQNTKLVNQQGELQVELKMTLYCPNKAVSGISKDAKPPYMIYPFGTATNAQIFQE